MDRNYFSPLPINEESIVLISSLPNFFSKPSQMCIRDSNKTNSKTGFIANTNVKANSKAIGKNVKATGGANRGS